MTEEKRKELIDALVKATGPVLIMMQGPFPPEMKTDFEYDILILYHDGEKQKEILDKAYSALPYWIDSYVRAESIGEYRENLEYGNPFEKGYEKNGTVIYPESE